MTQLALGQLQDDFSDNDFSTAPPWIGDEFLFIIGDNQLKLNAPNEDGQAYLATPSQAAQNASWEFIVHLAFNPSSSNYARVYLISDNVDLSSSLNGFFVSLGETKDEISLYRQNGDTFSKVIDGSDGVLNLANVTVAIKVIRNATGWQLFTDLGRTGTYVLEGFSDDNSLLGSKYFGVRCTYTSTRSDKFFFDDFYVQGGIVHDQTAPTLIGLETISATELQLTFSEPLNPSSAAKLENYNVIHTVGHPKEIVIDEDQKTVKLNFENHFSENVKLHLAISGVSDLAGNEIEPTEKAFIFSPPVMASIKDIIITEILADPSPSNGLPESEFVELFNRSEQSLNLSGWKFTDQSSSAILPDVILLPQEYIILAPENSDFSSYEKVLYLSAFPTLNNSSDVLILKDDGNVTIDSVKYFDTWYHDEDKKSGGWSLEIIDPNNICSERENWVASEETHGGTPGKQNSVFANKPDLTAPKLVSAIPINDSLIQLQFDEKLEKTLSLSTSFKITPRIDINSIAFSDPSLTQLHLSLSEEIQPGITYSLIAESIFDCAGNIISEENSTSTFGLPEEADSLDLLVNEILFNPRPTGVDFVEIINVSSKFIDLKNWAIGNFEDGVLKNEKILTPRSFLFPPGSILAITENPEILKGEYLLSNERNFLQVEDLPGFSDDQGSVALLDSDGNVIDFLIYSEDMHSIFIKDDEGVSLERISGRNSTDTQNWKSASSPVGYATPGNPNSNTIPEQPMTPDVLKVEPEIFSPRNGNPDFALIHYNFEKGGYVATIKIFDSQGRSIKEIANNDILGPTGFYRWDGDRSDGSKAAIGYYMIWFEIFDEHGTVRNFQKRVAIAAAF